MAIVTIEHGDMLPQTKAKAIDNISFIVTDQSLSVADYNLDLGGLSIFALRDAMNVNFNQFETDLGVAWTASQGTLTVDTQVTADDTMTIGTTAYTFKAGDTTTAAQGTLTVDTQPLADDTMTIGTKVYTFMADETADEDGEIDVGADLADAKTLIVAAINGSDGNNTAHTLVTAAAFATNDCVITAIVPGTVGNAIATTETFDAGTNVFDAATLGTTTAGAQLASGQIGVGDDLAANKISIVAAINGTDLVNTAHTLVTVADFVSDDCVITATTTGAAGNTIATTSSFTTGTNQFDGVTLGTTTAGLDEIDITPYANHVGGDSLFTMRDKLNSGFSFVDAI